jgi:hypothetical protein
MAKPRKTEIPKISSLKPVDGRLSCVLRVNVGMIAIGESARRGIAQRAR